MQTSSLKSVIGNVSRYFLSSYLKSLEYLKILQGPYLNFFSSYTEAAQDVRDEVGIKGAKSFGWIKQHALWGPNSQIG